MIRHRTVKLGTITYLPNKQRVCSPRSRLFSILSTKLSGLQWSVQNGMDTVSPNRYSWSPQQLAAFIIDALWTIWQLIPNSWARTIRSEWVVALQTNTTVRHLYWTEYRNREDKPVPPIKITHFEILLSIHTPKDLPRPRRQHLHQQHHLESHLRKFMHWWLTHFVTYYSKPPSGASNRNVIGSHRASYSNFHYFLR